MNKKVLVIAVALMAVAMLATPMVSTAQACRFRREPPQSFKVIHSGSLPVTEKTYWPNEDNPKMIVQRWGNNIVDYEIIIGEEHHYKLGVDFEYDQKCVWIAVGAPFIPYLGILMGSESNLWIITYEFDFSAVPGGIDGILKMLFVYKDGETSIRSLWGTRDLRNVHISATAVLGTHEGTVIGWPT